MTIGQNRRCTGISLRAVTIDENTPFTSIEAWHTVGASAAGSSVRLVQEGQMVKGIARSGKNPAQCMARDVLVTVRNPGAPRTVRLQVEHVQNGMVTTWIDISIDDARSLMARLGRVIDDRDAYDRDAPVVNLD